MIEHAVQIFVFDSRGVLFALARSVRAASVLTQVAEEDVLRSCEELTDSVGGYWFRYDHFSSVTCEGRFNGISVVEYDALCHSLLLI